MKNKLDNYFREQLSKREYPFQEAYWEAAQALIQRKKRRRRIFFWLFFGMAAIAISWWMWSVNTASSPSRIAGSRMEQQASSDAKPEASTLDDIAHAAVRNSSKARIEKHGSKPALQPGLTSLIATSPTQQAASEKEGVLAPSAVAAISVEGSMGKEALENTAGIPRPIEGFSAIPMLTPEPLPLPWEKRFVRTDLPKKLPWVFQNWSLAISQVFSAEHAGTRNRIGYRMGLRKEMQLKSNLYFFAGTGYEYRSGTFEASKVAVGRNYRFGLELDSQFLRPSALHFLDLPVGIGVSKKRHQLELSVSPRFLLGVRGERGFYQRKENTHPPQKQFIPVDSGWLVEDGFKRFSFSGDIAYWFRINKRTAIGASVHYQPGGVLDQNYSAPIGNYILKEKGEWTFRLSARLGF